MRRPTGAGAAPPLLTFLTFEFSEKRKQECFRCLSFLLVPLGTRNVAGESNELLRVVFVDSVNYNAPFFGVGLYKCAAFNAVDKNLHNKMLIFSTAPVPILQCVHGRQ